MTPNEYLHSVISGLSQKFPEGYMFAETGTDSGTTAVWAIKALAPGQIFHSVDPYGGKPYNIDDKLFTTFDYTDEKYRPMLRTVSQLADERKVTWCHWKMKSHDWVKLFDQIEFWAGGQIMEPKFCWAYLDGDHAWSAIIPEFQYFYDRMPSGGIICIDDYNLLPEDSAPSKLAPFKGKISYHTEDEHFRIYFTKD